MTNCLASRKAMGSLVDASYFVCRCCLVSNTSRASRGCSTTENVAHGRHAPTGGITNSRIGRCMAYFLFLPSTAISPAPMRTTARRPPTIDRVWKNCSDGKSGRGRSVRVSAGELFPKRLPSHHVQLQQQGEQEGEKNGRSKLGTRPTRRPSLCAQRDAQIRRKVEKRASPRLGAQPIQAQVDTSYRT